VALAVLALAVTLAVHVSPWATKGFGVSHDGYNGAMWGLGARAARDDPLGHRLGGVQPQGYRYANHPPLTVWAATATTALGGERPAAVRAPAALASLAALAVLALLLRDAGFSPPEAVAGVVLAGTSAMFLTYGAMLDTPVVALPFGLAAVAAAQRAWQGRPAPDVLVLAVGALAGLAGWQALLAAGLAGGLALLSGRGPGPRSARVLLAGAAAGLALTLGWIAWVEGTLLELADQASLRSGAGESWLDRQGRFLLDLYGPALLAVLAAGLLVGLARGDGADDRAGGRTGWWGGARPLLAVLVTVVVLYVVAFRQAAGIHDYWTYWGVALVAGAGAAGARAVLGLRRRLPDRAGPVVAAVVALVVLGVAAAGAGRRSDADRAIQEGLDAVPVLAAAPRAPEPDAATVAVRDADRTGAPWANWATHGEALRPTRAELAALPADRLLFFRAEGPLDPALRAAAVAVRGRYVLVPAGAYRQALGR